MPSREASGPSSPAGLTYGVDDRPPRYVLWVAAIQHVLLATVTTVFPLLVLEAAHASHETILQVMSGSLLRSVSEASCLPEVRDLGSGALMPASFSGIYFIVSVAAAHQGGLPLVAGMTMFAGVVQLVMARGVHDLRPYLPTEIAGFAMLMSGLTLGVIGFNLITGVSAASDPMGDNMGTPALLGVVCLLAMIALFVWGAAGLRLYVMLIVLAGGYTAGAVMGLVPFNEIKSASLLVHPPLPSPSWPTFAVNLCCPSPLRRSPPRCALSAISPRSRRSTTPAGSAPTCSSIRRGLIQWHRHDIRRSAGQRGLQHSRPLSASR